MTETDRTTSNTKTNLDLSIIYRNTKRNEHDTPCGPEGFEIGTQGHKASEQGLGPWCFKPGLVINWDLSKTQTWSGT